MECACVYVDNDEYSVPLAAKKRKARKQHKCIECRKIIEPKEIYMYEKNVYDGEISECKTCLDCLSAREVFFCEGYYYGEIWNLLWDHLTDGGIDDCFGKNVLKLTEKAKEKVLKLMDEYREKYDD